MEILRVQFAIVMVVSLLGVAGCKSIKDATGLLEQQSVSANLSSRELRTIVDDLVLQYSSRVELAADKIGAQTRDPRIRKNALIWKVNGIAACFQAATRRDSLGAFLDIWILNKQSLALFQTEMEEPLFGGSQPIAIEMAVQMESAMRNILLRLGDDLPIDEDFATQFASDYPIDNLYFDRASIAEHYTEYIEKITVKNKDLREVVGSLDGQLDQLHKLSAMYAEFLPKQARWQAEILVLETIEDETFSAVIATATSAAQSAEKMADVVNQLPNILSSEREWISKSVTEERIATLQSIKQLQVDTLQQLEDERIAVLEDVRKERQIILAALHEERLDATGDLKAFGSDIVNRIDASTDNKIDTVAQRSKDVADHLVLRVVELFGVLVLFSLFLFWLFRTLNRMKQSDDETDPPQIISFPRFEVQDETTSNKTANDDSIDNAA